MAMSDRPDGLGSGCSCASSNAPVRYVAMDEPRQPLSKKASKRLAREEATADARRAKVLQKRKAVRERQKLERAEARASEGGSEGPVQQRQQRRNQQVALTDARASRVGLCLDLSFENVMAEHPKDVAKLAKQIERCYGDNRRAAHPLQLHLASMDAAAGSGSTTAAQLQARCGFDSWDVHRHEQHYLEVFPTEQLVYLTSESDNLLERLEPNKIYVVGALVDHNRRKGLTHGLAQAAGVTTARLPIAEHVSLQCGTMLAVNHVFQLCLEFEQHEGQFSMEES